MTSARKRNPKAFELVWNTIIAPAISRYCEEPSVSCEDIEYAKRMVMKAYNTFNLHCSQTYMADPSKPLNQRKVAACYAQAIIATRPLNVDLFDPRSSVAPVRDGRKRFESRPCFANERLAIHTACSILVSFLRRAVDDPRCALTTEQRNKAHSHLDRGIDLLQQVDDGEFLLNLEKTLSFMALEGNYNTTLLACLFSYWEACVLPPDVYRRVLSVFAKESAGLLATGYVAEAQSIRETLDSGQG